MTSRRCSASRASTTTRAIILYGDNNNWFAAYALWVLELYGHDNAALMDGGRVKWLAEERATTTADTSVGRCVVLGAGPGRGAARRDRDEVLASVGDEGAQMVDVRSPAEFTGEIIAPPGHVRKRRSAPATSPARSTCRGRAPSTRTARSAPSRSCASCTAARASTRATPTIAYCRIGERSSHTWFVLKHLMGIDDVKNYDGSWTEYGSLINVPIAR